MLKLKYILGKISRKKLSLEERIAPLKRVLRIPDLVMIGVSGTIGSGIYVITGSVIEKAGPACIFSYLIAGFSAFLSALCYCEFSSLYPTSGSAYSYTFFSFGELAAFIIGWNLVLEYVVGAASVIRSFSIYVSSGLDLNFNTFYSIPLLNIIAKLDYFSLCTSLIFTLTTLYEIKSAKVINCLATIICIVSISLTSLIGLAYSNLDNWKNFAPHGSKGVLAAASTCFYAYIGFDVVAATAEEALHPEYSISFSIMLTIVICTFLYVSSTLVITLMVPSTFFSYDTTFTSVFAYCNVPIVGYIITIGAVFGFVGCIYASFLPTPRILYAMANDGLIYSFLGVLSSKTSSPLNSTLLSGALISIFAFFVSMEDLIQMMSIGTLMAYTMVSFCTLLLRYNTASSQHYNGNINGSKSNDSSNYRDTSEVRAASVFLIIILFLIMVLCFLLVNPMTIVSTVHSTFILITLLFMILSCLYKLSTYSFRSIGIGIGIGTGTGTGIGTRFKVPLVPWIPALAIFLNILLLFTLKRRTWISFIIWLSLGMVIYSTYGYKHSIASRPS